MHRNLTKRWIAGIGTIVALTGCAGRSAPGTSTVLKTEDFITDPATIPTTREATPTAAGGVARAGSGPAHAPMQTVRDARQGLPDVSVEPGPPALPPLTNVGEFETPTLIDAKIGEINGRPIRVEDMFMQIGPQLEVTARTRTLSPFEWSMIGKKPSNEAAKRQDWLALAEVLFRGRLNGILNDEVLSAEARAKLKPEQRQGLSHYVREATENKRRNIGGSTAELERNLRAENQDEQRFGRYVETAVLINMQIEEKVKSRYKASWKDIKRFYERNIEMFRPPTRAKFRMIIVPADNAEGIKAVQSALDAKQPFATVAAMPANDYNPGDGGLFGDGQTVIVGPYEQATPFNFDELNVAAQKLHAGEHTPQPVSRVDRTGKTVLTWLCLESLENRTRYLGEPEVQKAIADRLDLRAQEAGKAAYIRRLVNRANFTDLDVMTQQLVDIAADRYWPAGR